MTAAGGRDLYLIDTSAMARLHHPPVREVVTQLIADGVAATCVTLDLEAGYSGREPAEVERIAVVRRRLYVVLPIDEAAAQRARDVQVLMATGGLHRAAGVIDLLTAAVAEQHGATMLHYDADFEHIASMTGQAHRWVMPKGSIT